MTQIPFTPTTEQETVISHDGSAFISACPGAGKTQVMVERARVLLSQKSAMGLAFLSFSNDAISELSERLRREGLLAEPRFPHFVGTFDSFVWQFFMAPFGIPEFPGQIRLVPDKGDMLVRPLGRGRALPLSCFDPITGAALPNVLNREHGWDVTKHPEETKQYVENARTRRRTLLERGQLDFDEVRHRTTTRLRQDEIFRQRLGAALAGRFQEVIIDEAQDCNPADLQIVDWIRRRGIPTKIICDPHQSIFGFRGAQASNLTKYSETFEPTQNLTFTGNFRSSQVICNAVAAFRPGRRNPDVARGRLQDIDTRVQILSYPGSKVPMEIGLSFRALLNAQGLDPHACPVVASTWDSAGKAVGRSLPKKASRDLTLLLARSVAWFHRTTDYRESLDALRGVHRVSLRIADQLDGLTYHEYIVTNELRPRVWRPKVLAITAQLRPHSEEFADASVWLKRAQGLFAEFLPSNTTKSIRQRLKYQKELPSVLGLDCMQVTPPRSIHAVKGHQFPAVCVVMTTNAANAVLEYLETFGRGEPDEEPHPAEEDARKLYVAVSRAQQLLVIAAPQSQTARVRARLEQFGAPVTVSALASPS